MHLAPLDVVGAEEEGADQLGRQRARPAHGQVARVVGEEAPEAGDAAAAHGSQGPGAERLEAVHVGEEETDKDRVRCIRPPVQPGGELVLVDFARGRGEEVVGDSGPRRLGEEIEDGDRGRAEDAPGQDSLSLPGGQFGRRQRGERRGPQRLLRGVEHAVAVGIQVGEEVSLADRLRGHGHQARVAPAQAVALVAAEAEELVPVYREAERPPELVLPVRRLGVGVPRRVVDGAVPAPLLHHPELVVPDGLGAEDGQNRFEDGHVDDLAPAGRLPGVESEHDGPEGGQRRDAVGQAEGG